MTYRMWKSFRALLMHDSNCHASYQHVHDTHTRQTMKHPCYSKAYHHKRQMRGIYPLVPLALVVPIFLFPFFLPLFVSRQKKEGAILCRVSGEAVGCPVRNHGRKSAQWAHSPLRNGSYRSKLLHFTRAKTMRRTQSLELSDAHYSINPTACGR